jgi:hypothetical protein
MSELRSLLDQLSAVDIGQMSVEMLDEDIDELVYGRQMMDVLLAQRVRGMTDRGGHVELGYPSPTAYLTGKGMSAGRARRHVIRAYASDSAPGTSKAWSDGRLSTDQAELLIRMAAAVPDQFPEAEDRLVEIVEPLSVTSTAKAVEYWRQSVDGPGDLSLESQHVRCGVSLSTTIGGMQRLDGWMTSTAGQALETALNALTSPPTEDDTRTPRQRRHDALEDLARNYLDHGETPTVGGEKPHITVITDIDALKGIAGGTHENLDGDVLDVETVRMLACDASISRIVVGPDSEVLDIGRKTRVWTAAQRRAIIARDRHCTAPGCERPPDWCDIHHLTHWADEGSTSVDQGTLLCRFHHTLEHIRAFLEKRRLKTWG